MARPLRIATRSSDLALRQANEVRSRLAALGVPGELVTYTTVGDRRLDVPLAAIGGKGLFTAELERDLLDGAVNCCVHSLKDLPTESPAGLELVAILEREDPRDALVLSPALASAMAGDVPPLDRLPAGARVGTSSLRRRAQLRAARPDLEVVELRGNVPTRLGRVERGEVDAAVLAAAGLHRLGLAERVAAYLDAPDWLPAAGQGAIAVQARADDASVRRALALLDHRATREAVTAERALLAALEGGCQVPIGALARADEDGALVLHALVASIDGTAILRGERRVEGTGLEEVGRALAAELLACGGATILAAARAAGEVPRPQPE